MAQYLALDPDEPAQAEPNAGRPRTPLRIASEDAPVDLEAAQRAAADFLAALGSASTGRGCARRRPGWRVPTPSCSPRGRST
jgi:hypothetical protein